MYAAIVFAALLGIGTALTPRVLRKEDAASSANTLDHNVGINLCPTCVGFSEEAFDTLLNITLNMGVVGSCSVLCGALEQKTNNRALGAVCNILCDTVGINEFVKIVAMEDPDPILFCEVFFKVCPINDNGDAQILELAVDPTSGAQGLRTISFQLNSTNGVGTGQIVLSVQTVDRYPVKEAHFMEAHDASAFPSPQVFKINATPDPTCDPSKGPCEQWTPGDYVAKVVVCNGMCGSHHSHSQQYDTQNVTFTITP